MLIDIIAQIIGFVGLGILVYHFQINKRSGMLSWKLLSLIVFTIHFSLLGAWTGAAMNSIGGVRIYIYKFRESRKWADNKIWPYVFIIIFWIFGILTWIDYYSIFPVIGMTTGTLAYWCKKPVHIRLLALISPPVWFIYNFIVGSYAGMIGSIFIFSSTLIGLIRFDILKKS